MIVYMGTAVIDELSEIRGAGMFAITADETTDISHKEHVLMCIHTLG